VGGARHLADLPGQRQARLQRADRAVEIAVGDLDAGADGHEVGNLLKDVGVLQHRVAGIAFPQAALAAGRLVDQVEDFLVRLQSLACLVAREVGQVLVGPVRERVAVGLVVRFPQQRLKLVDGVLVHRHRVARRLGAQVGQQRDHRGVDLACESRVGRRPLPDRARPARFTQRVALAAAAAHPVCLTSGYASEGRANRRELNRNEGVHRWH